jgi:hypothetical protein
VVWDGDDCAVSAGEGADWRVWWDGASVLAQPPQQWTVRNPTRDRPSPAVEVQADKLFVPASNAKILTVRTDCTCTQCHFVLPV